MVLVSVSRTHTVSIRRLDFFQHEMCQQAWIIFVNNCRLITLLDFDAYLIDRERRKRMKKAKDSDENLFHWILAENGTMPEQIAKLRDDDAIEGVEEGHTTSRDESQRSNQPSPSESSLTEEQCQENAADSIEDIQEEPTFFTNSSSHGGVALELQDDVSVSETSGSANPVRL